MSERERGFLSPTLSLSLNISFPSFPWQEKSKEEKMSVIDILFRVDSICKKYDNYDVDEHHELNASSDDAFARLYSAVESKIDATLRKSEAASMETSRVAIVFMNAEIRRAKARMMEEDPKLQKLALKKVKGLSKEDLTTRNDLVLALPERIQSIPDGPHPGSNKLEAGQLHHLIKTSGLTQMGTSMVTSFNRLKNQVNLGKNMKCGK